MTSNVAKSSARIGADVGGTFTDVVLRGPDGELSLHKVLSTPPNYDAAVVEAIKHQVASARDGNGQMAISEVVHGTTVATNAVLEHRGSLTALVTTLGFRDVLELRRMRMPQLYDLFWQKPASLVPRYLCLEVKERMAADGTVVTALDKGSVDDVIAALDQAKVEAVAVCLLHSYLYPEHERAVGAALRQALPQVSISLSSELLREQQEYERTATTVINAYVQPLMNRYLREIRRGMVALDIQAPLMIMRSSGGVMTDEQAARSPVYALESGPTAGVIAAQGLAQLLGQTNVISFDMGGTTAKAALIEDGKVVMSREFEVGASLSASSQLLRGGGELIRTPTLDIAEVGAGGGSIAWLDPAGALQVGPMSAGAVPGPACYGLGGTEATVTDANVALGLIPTGALASGALTVSARLGDQALRPLAESLEMTLAGLARGIHELANAKMMRALRAVSSVRGRDPREFALTAFGGSGPVHAAALADDLGIRSVIIPPLAGVFSAVGLLFARMQLEEVRFCRLDARAPDLDVLEALRAEMHEKLLNEVPTHIDLGWRLSADIRYRGQSWDIEAEWEGDLDNVGAADTVDRFEREHGRLYGHRVRSGASVEIRALRMRVIGPDRDQSSEIRWHDESEEQHARRAVNFGKATGVTDTPVWTRRTVPSTWIAGPLLIDEYDTTVVVPPWWEAMRHDTGTIMLRREETTK